jgi:hypothetical protein
LPGEDEVLTGRREQPAPPDTDGVVLTGPGLAVARGPVAAATVGYLAAIAALERAGATHRSSLLLAAGVTHHRFCDDRRDDAPSSGGAPTSSPAPPSVRSVARRRSGRSAPDRQTSATCSWPWRG